MEQDSQMSSDNQSYIVGLTAHSTETYKEKCFEVGMNQYSKLVSKNLVSKPADFQVLKAILQKLRLI